MGDKITSVVAGEAEFMKGWYDLHGRYQALKSKKIAGEFWSTELEAEFIRVEQGIKQLTIIAQEKGIIGKDSMTTAEAPAAAAGGK